MSCCKILKLIFVCVLAAGLVSAYSVLCNVAGAVKDFRNNSLLNVTITAFINDTDRGNTTPYSYLGESRFNLDVQGEIGDVGKTIRFMIDDIPAAENTGFRLWIGDQNLALHQGLVNHTILLNEFMTGRQGFVELYNNGSHTANIKGWSLSGSIAYAEVQHAVVLSQGWNLVSVPLLSSGNVSYDINEDDYILPQKFAVFPANQTGLALDGGSGWLTLSKPENTLADNLAYSSVQFNASWIVFPANVSVGRKTDGSPEWRYFNVGTPGSGNQQ